MRKFNKLFKVGTKVLTIGSCGQKEWDVIKEIDETRQWIKLEKIMGSHQRNHIEKFSNKA